MKDRAFEVPMTTAKHMGGNYIDKLNVIICPVTHSYTGLPIKKIAHLIRISVASFKLPSRLISLTILTELR